VIDAAFVNSDLFALNRHRYSAKESSYLQAVEQDAQVIRRAQPVERMIEQFNRLPAGSAHFGQRRREIAAGSPVDGAVGETQGGIRRHPVFLFQCNLFNDVVGELIYGCNFIQDPLPASPAPQGRFAEFGGGVERSETEGVKYSCYN